MTTENNELPLRIHKLLQDAQRLKAVADSKVMDTAPEENFDRIASTVSLVLQTPVAKITFLDEHRQWLKGSVGFDVPEVPTNISMCSYTLEDNDAPTVALDAAKDARFAENPFVKNSPNVRFYAGFPIQFRGESIGVICAYDMQPHSALTDEQNEVLVKLSQEVSDILETKAA